MVDYATAYYTLGPEDIAKVPSFRPLEVTLTNGRSDVKLEGLKRMYDERCTVIVPLIDPVLAQTEQD
jgi:hypothetical protein